MAAKNRLRTVTRTFRNTAAIQLPISATSPVSGSLNPSAIAVDGLKGKIRDVNVLLVGPDGQTAIVMSMVGEETTGNGAVTLRFDDEAATVLPDEETFSGTYRPTNHDGVAVVFNTPAPPVTSANAALSMFDGADSNGTWRLFVQDKPANLDPGVLAEGWTLEITAKVKAKKKR